MSPHDSLNTTPPLPSPSRSAAWLNQLNGEHASFAVIRASGADAAKFLHSQLSNDVETLGTDQWRLAAYCNPKGRMIASVMLWQDAAPASDQQGSPDYCLLVAADLAASFVKRLSMFVLRLKCRLLVDPSPVFAIDAASLRDHAALLGAVSALAPKRMASTTIQGLDLLAVGPSSVEPSAYLITGPSNAVNEALAKLQAEAGLSVEPSSKNFEAALIEQGIPVIRQSVVEHFIPQAVNFDLIGGVSFSKGCYPGQEVVARSHYLGKQKRRMVGVDLALPAAGCSIDALDGDLRGQDVFSSLDPTQPAGSVVDWVRAADDRIALLVELPRALSTGRLTIKSLEGPEVKLRPLPYSLPTQDA